MIWLRLQPNPAKSGAHRKHGLPLMHALTAKRSVSSTSMIRVCRYALKKHGCFKSGSDTLPTIPYPVRNDRLRPQWIQMLYLMAYCWFFGSTHQLQLNHSPGVVFGSREHLDGQSQLVESAQSFLRYKKKCRFFVNQKQVQSLQTHSSGWTGTPSEVATPEFFFPWGGEGLVWLSRRCMERRPAVVPFVWVHLGGNSVHKSRPL